MSSLTFRSLLVFLFQYQTWGVKSELLRRDFSLSLMGDGHGASHHVENVINADTTDSIHDSMENKAEVEVGHESLDRLTWERPPIVKATSSSVQTSTKTSATIAGTDSAKAESSGSRVSGNGSSLSLGSRRLVEDPMCFIYGGTSDGEPFSNVKVSVVSQHGVKNTLEVKSPAEIMEQDEQHVPVDKIPKCYHSDPDSQAYQARCTRAFSLHSSDASNLKLDEEVRLAKENAGEKKQTKGDEHADVVKEISQAFTGVSAADKGEQPKNEDDANTTHTDVNTQEDTDADKFPATGNSTTSVAVADIDNSDISGFNFATLEKNQKKIGKLFDKQLRILEKNGSHSESSDSRLPPLQKGKNVEGTKDDKPIVNTSSGIDNFSEGMDNNTTKSENTPEGIRKWKEGKAEDERKEREELQRLRKERKAKEKTKIFKLVVEIDFKARPNQVVKPKEVGNPLESITQELENEEADWAVGKEFEQIRGPDTLEEQQLLDGENQKSMESEVGKTEDRQSSFMQLYKNSIQTGKNFTEILVDQKKREKDYAATHTFGSDYNPDSDLVDADSASILQKLQQHSQSKEGDDCKGGAVFLMCTNGYASSVKSMKASAKTSIFRDILGDDDEDHDNFLQIKKTLVDSSSNMQKADAAGIYPTSNHKAPCTSPKWVLHDTQLDCRGCVDKTDCDACEACKEQNVAEIEKHRDVIGNECENDKWNKDDCSDCEGPADCKACKECKAKGDRTTLTRENGTKKEKEGSITGPLKVCEPESYKYFMGFNKESDPAPVWIQADFKRLDVLEFTALVHQGDAPNDSLFKKWNQTHHKEIEAVKKEKLEDLNKKIDQSKLKVDVAIKKADQGAARADQLAADAEASASHEELRLQEKEDAVKKAVAETKSRVKAKLQADVDDDPAKADTLNKVFQTADSVVATETEKAKKDAATEVEIAEKEDKVEQENAAKGETIPEEDKEEENNVDPEKSREATDAGLGVTNAGSGVTTDSGLRVDDTEKTTEKVESDKKTTKGNQLPTEKNKGANVRANVGTENEVEGKEKTPKKGD